MESIDKRKRRSKVWEKNGKRPSGEGGEKEGNVPGGETGSSRTVALNPVLKYA